MITYSVLIPSNLLSPFEISFAALKGIEIVERSDDNYLEYLSENVHTITVCVISPGDSADRRYLIEAIRSIQGRMPILEISAQDMPCDNAVSAFAQGVNDYLPEKYNLFELIYRLRSLAKNAPMVFVDENYCFMLGDCIKYDPLTKIVATEKGNIVLSLEEAHVLSLLLINSARDKFVTIEMIIAAIYGPHLTITDKMEQHIEKIVQTIEALLLVGLSTNKLVKSEESYRLESCSIELVPR